jgi:Fic family protein
MDFTPIIPQELNGNIDTQLLIKAEKICTKSAKMVGNYNIKVINEIKDLLRMVNSYYSNKIESEGTHPINIEKAMRAEYSNNEKAKNLQLLSLAHIKTQDFIEDYCQYSKNNPYSKEFIKDIHKEFYSQDGMESFIKIQDDKDIIKMTPGELRQRDVKIGQHIPVSYKELDSMMNKYEDFYKPKQMTQALKLIYALSAHHRLSFIHPFLDGNGRTSRLVLDAALLNMNLDGYGLWNISRGLARNLDKYKLNLAYADTKRLNDLDGRGSLSTKELKKYVDFMLNIAMDQVEYMQEQLDLSTLSSRIENYVEFSNKGMYRLAEPLPKYSNILLKELLVLGEMPRGDVAKLIGKKTTVTSTFINKLIKMNYLKSDEPRGKIRIKFNAHFAMRLFPELMPDIE